MSEQTPISPQVNRPLSNNHQDRVSTQKFETNPR